MTTPSYSDNLAVEAVEASTEWPAEWPVLTSAMLLPRGQRAEMFERYADLVERLPDLQAAVADIGDDDPDRPAGNAGRPAWEAYARGKNIDVTKDMGRDAIIAAVDEQAAQHPSRLSAKMRSAAAFTRIAGDIIESVRPAAADSEAFEAWADKATDIDVLSLFMRWAQRTQLGEATSSAS